MTQGGADASWHPPRTRPRSLNGPTVPSLCSCTTSTRAARSPQPSALMEDGGSTWIASRTFTPAHYVYQCMTILPDGTLGLLWEREMQGLYFTRIPLEWLEAAKI